ncbi:uncharacterized protein LOC17887195 isoform X2 [Capsella rubella]|uniref:uncharacterized protein LOC17887195 isoform X2 n=1 Tax=Capsella rubella TaxID=81985 RepID=UPI000CD57BD7|nr:uncharacterized protein LOC17887195 isoform X2 [Capsella rubella]
MVTPPGKIPVGFLPVPAGVSEGTCRDSKMAMLVTLAMVVRSKPHVFVRVLPSLRLRRMYKGRGHIALTFWLIAQASKEDLSVGLLSWAHNLLPLVCSHPQSTDTALTLVEKILAKPDDQARFVKAPFWEGVRLIPPYSFEILLRLTFPASSVPSTSRFKAIYPLLRKMALVRTSRRQPIEEIFIFSLRLSGEGNTVLAEEARSIAIWSLTVTKSCWNLWENLYKVNLKATVDLLKKIVGKFKDGVSERMNQQIFTFSLMLAGEGNPVLPQQGTTIAIWSLTTIVDCWKQRGNISEENLEACVAILKELVERCKDHSLNPSSSPSYTLSPSPGSKAWKQIIRKIFTLSLKLAGEANPVLAKEAITIAIWSLTENVDCWKSWDNLYKENVEASVALLKRLVEEWKDHSLKLLSSPSDTFTLGQTMKSIMLQNKNAIAGGSAFGSLYQEADKSCEVISWRLSPVRSTLKDTASTAVVVVASVFLAAYGRALCGHSVFCFCLGFWFYFCGFPVLLKLKSYINL